MITSQSHSSRIDSLEIVYNRPRSYHSSTLSASPMTGVVAFLLSFAVFFETFDVVIVGEDYFQIM